MSLDPKPTDAELVERYRERTGIRLGKGSPIIPQLRREAAGKNGVVITNDPLDPQGRMNKTERRRAVELEAKRRAGEIQTWQFEAIALILADRTRYHPDFLITENDGTFTLEEIKGGFVRDDAAVKLKVAARLFPHFRFRMFKSSRGGPWEIREIRA